MRFKCSANVRFCFDIGVENLIIIYCRNSHCLQYSQCKRPKKKNKLQTAAEGTKAAKAALVSENMTMAVTATPPGDSVFKKCMCDGIKYHKRKPCKILDLSRYCKTDFCGVWSLFTTLTLINWSFPN